MRKWILIALSILVAAFLNYSIYKKEQVKKSGEVILLSLAPVDPRSIMQGDYMELRYTLENDIPFELISSQKSRGFLVVRPGENRVGGFVRFHAGERLSTNEKLLYYHKDYESIKIAQRSFFFQEGHGKLYDDAKYGIFKFGAGGESILIGLADSNYKEIKAVLGTRKKSNK